jgi:hypothetical protein
MGMGGRMWLRVSVKLKVQTRYIEIKAFVTYD